MKLLLNLLITKRVQFNGIKLLLRTNSSTALKLGPTETSNKTWWMETSGNWDPLSSSSIAAEKLLMERKGSGRKLCGMIFSLLSRPVFSVTNTPSYTTQGHAFLLSRGHWFHLTARFKHFIYTLQKLNFQNVNNRAHQGKNLTKYKLLVELSLFFWDSWARCGHQL